MCGKKSSKSENLTWLYQFLTKGQGASFSHDWGLRFLISKYELKTQFWEMSYHRLLRKDGEVLRAMDCVQNEEFTQTLISVLKDEISGLVGK